MQFSDALHLMQHYTTENDRRPMELAIVVVSQGKIGATTCVEVKNIQAGIDWDMGKFMIYPAEPLTTLSAEDVANIRKSVAGGQSWHAYQAHKAHKEQLKAVEAERDELKRKLAAAEALVAARIKDVPVDAPLIAMIGDFAPEHIDECKSFHDAIRAQCNSNALVVCMQSDFDIKALDESTLRAAGWVRAEGGAA